MKADAGVRGPWPVARGPRPTPGLCENLVLLRLTLLTWEAGRRPSRQSLPPALELHLQAGSLSWADSPRES